MSVAEDITLGLHATVNTNREDATFACVRAASSLGFHGQSIVNEDGVTVKVFYGLVPVMRNVSPLVTVRIEPLGDQYQVLDATIGTYKTLQTTFFFIKLSPKRLRGKRLYRKFLTTLERELRAVDRGGGAFQWVGGGS